MKKIILITMLMSAVFAQADKCEAETIDTQCNALDSQSDREECRRYYHLLCENTLTEDELKEIEALEEEDRKWEAERKRKREEEIAKKEAERLAKWKAKLDLEAKKEAERLAKLQAKKDLAKLLAKTKWTSEEYRNWQYADTDNFTLNKTVKKYGMVKERASHWPGALEKLYPDLEAAFGAEYLENNITLSSVHFFSHSGTGFSCSQIMDVSARNGDSVLKVFYDALEPKQWTEEEREICYGDGPYDEDFCSAMEGDKMINPYPWQRDEVRGSHMLYMNPRCADNKTGGHDFTVDLLMSHPNKEAEEEILEAIHRRIEQATHDASDDALELDPN